MRRQYLLLFAILFLTTSFDAKAGQPPISFTGIGDLHGGIFRSFAYGVSADGSVVVGTGQAASGQSTVTKAIRWTFQDGIQELPSGACGGSEPSYGNGISGDGRTIVGANTVFSGRAAVWSKWGPIDLGTFTCSTPFATEALDASFDGDIVVGRGPNGLATIWTPTSVSQVQLSNSAAVAVSDGGTVVLIGQIGGFIWSEESGATNVIPSGGSAFGLSGDGTIVAGDFGGHAVRWTAECGMEDTGIGDAAYAMSYNGIRLGGTSTTNEAWIWDPIAGGRSVKTYLVDELGLTEANGWQLERITAFSSDGTVAVGWGTNPSGNTEGWVAVIPEISILRGDFDLDGVLDPNDVASFTATVADPCGSSVQDRYFADMNDDRFVNGTDVVLFTSSLLQN